MKGYEISVLQRVQRPILQLTGTTKRKLTPQSAVHSNNVDDLDPALKGKSRKQARQEKYIAQQEKANAIATGQAMARPHATYATGMGPPPGSGPHARSHAVYPSTLYQPEQSPMFPHVHQGMHPHPPAGPRSMVVPSQPPPPPPLAQPQPAEKELKASREQVGLVSPRESRKKVQR